MEQNDKIDLKSVNKKSKGANVSIKKLITPQKGPKRDDEGKFTGGSGGLKTFKKFNWRRAMPLILIVTIVGGLFVFQTFATSDPTGCRAVPEEFKGYRSAQMPAWLVDKLYQDFHNETPTQAERRHWSITRVAQLRQELGESKRCQIQYKIMLEIKATTPQMRAEKQKNNSTQSSDVLKTVYANEMRKEATDNRNGSGAQTLAGTFSNLAVMPILNPTAVTTQSGTNFTGRWDASWPTQAKACAIVYSNQKNAKVTFNFSAKTRQSKSVDLSTLTSLNANKQPYTINEIDNRTRTVYAMGKYEVCTDYVTKREARNTSRGVAPSTYSLSIVPTESTSSRQAVGFVESYSIKK